MMQAKSLFDEKIVEIELLKNAGKNASEERTYFKVIILLLCAKLEKYVKDSANEYVQEIVKSKVKKKVIPEKLVLEILKNEILRINDIKIENYYGKEKYKNKAKNLMMIWDEDYVLQLLEDDFSISISGNGTKVLQECYKKIGIPNLFDNINDFSKSQEISGISSVITYSVLDYLNKIIKIRHEIIHEDATPNITKQEIGLYVEILEYFVCQVDQILSSELGKIRSAS